MSTNELLTLPMKLVDVSFLTTWITFGSLQSGSDACEYWGEGGGGGVYCGWGFDGSQPPVNAAFDQGCRRRRPRSSAAAAASVARAPSSAPNRNITEKESGAAGDITIVRPAAAALTS